MALKLRELIRTNKIFASLDDATLRELLAKSQKQYVAKNAILFRQGEVSTYIYVLIAGKITISIKAKDKQKKIIGEVLPGETLGELSALSHEPRAITAKASSNSILLALSSSDFKDVLQKHPTILFEIVNMFVDRSRKIIAQLTEPHVFDKHIAILPANPSIAMKVFIAMLQRHARNIPNLIIFSDEDLEWQQVNDTKNWLQQKLTAVEKNADTILYLLSSATSALAQACFEKINIAYVVANINAVPEVHTTVLEKIQPIQAKCIFLHEQASYPPKNTALWLRKASFVLHHHVHLERSKDYARLLRFMRGQAVGVVLGGGGLRCWAQLGAINALLEADVPIDMIGGTSAGGIVAGFYALHESLEDPGQQLKALAKVTRKTVSWRNFTWPAISLFSGKAYTRIQKKIFGVARIENLSLPAFFVSCNLATNTQTVQQRGYVWKAIRSTTAVPAIFPPVVVKGQLHLDGGILNNLPADIMRKFLGKQGTVIAIELTHNGHDQARYKFPPVLRFWQMILMKLGLIRAKYKFPPFIETFLKSLLAGSAAKQFENGLLADVLICPDLSQYGLLNVTEKQEQELIQLGYAAAVVALKNWRKKSDHTKIILT